MKLTHTFGRTLAAWLSFLAADIVMKLGSFHLLCTLVRKFPVRRRHPGRLELRDSLRDAMNRAAALYFHRILCLQRSAAATCLLRWHGLPAQMVIAAQKMPFRAHAWVECEGIVFNEQPTVRERFVVLERC